MENHQNPDIIRQLAQQAKRTTLLPANEQTDLNRALYTKLMQFLDEMRSDPLRPQAMTEADTLFEETHTRRLTELAEHRQAGGRVVTLFCHALPPELFYAYPNLIPINTCAGAAETEPYARDMAGCCSLAKSAVGFAEAGMCAFHHLADYGLSVHACHSLTAAHNRLQQTELLSVMALDQPWNQPPSSDMWQTLQQLSGMEPDPERLMYYAQLFGQIRALYDQIDQLRLHPSVPLAGHDALWLKQLYLATEPHRLLALLQNVVEQLQQRVTQGIGYKDLGKRRVLLIGQRNMPPYTQSYRLLHQAGVHVVAEYMCLGTEKPSSLLDDLHAHFRQGGHFDTQLSQLFFAQSHINPLACNAQFDAKAFAQLLGQHQIDAVATLALENCWPMQAKLQRINEQVRLAGLPVLALALDYRSSYLLEQQLSTALHAFLHP